MLMCTCPNPFGGLWYNAYGRKYCEVILFHLPVRGVYLLVCTICTFDVLQTYWKKVDVNCYYQYQQSIRQVVRSGISSLRQSTGRYVLTIMFWFWLGVLMWLIGLQWQLIIGYHVVGGYVLQVYQWKTIEDRNFPGTLILQRFFSAWCGFRRSECICEQWRKNLPLVKANSNVIV